MAEDSVIIKKIGEIDIRLKETTDFKPTWKSVLIGFGLPSIFVIYLFQQMIMAPEAVKANTDFYFFLWMIGFISLFIGFILNMAWVGWKKIPCYAVFIQDKRDSYIQIKRTTPEQDQVEICKASQSLESKARSYNEELKGLVKIAGNCK